MAMTDAKTIFVDTNVIVYASTLECPQHAVALGRRREFQAAGRELWISNQVLREYLAVRTRPQTQGTLVPARTVIERIDYFRTHFKVAQDTARVMEKLLTLVQQVEVGGKQIHDANIVATMLSSGVTHLLTHNVEDFDRYSAFITTIPLVEG